MDEPHEFVDPIAGLDQAIRALSDFARVIRAYHQALIGQGFSAAEALILANTYQSSLLQQSS